MTLDLDPDDLSRAVGRPVATYDVVPIDPHLRLHSVTGGVYRVTGDGFSLVVKVVRHGEDATPDGLWGSGADPGHRNYWKREWLAFDSGLLASLPGGLRAPRRLLTTEHGEAECWVWMEDVRGRHGRSLLLDDYGSIAEALGSTQGAYASGGAPLPDDEWLSRSWLRSWVTICSPLVEVLDDDGRWAAERLVVLRGMRSRILALWDQRERLLAISESAPATLTHWDFWPSNVYVANTADCVAIDWSQVGIGAVAQDLDQLTLDTLWQQVRPDESIDRLEKLVLDGYLRGLGASHLDVGAAELRRWYAASAAVRFAWMAGGQADLLADADRVRAQEQRYGRTYDAILTTKTRAIEHAVTLGEWALESTA
jgi:hypothetical protein